ncbi:Tex family protein [Glutamicibacter endophyticus]
MNASASVGHNGAVSSAEQRMIRQLAEELSVESPVAPWQVSAAVELLDSGSTVPFIARYRKEVTGGLSDSQLRLLEDRLRYLRELEDRRATIRQAIEQAGKLDETLAASIAAAGSKAELEDLYLPFKSKRRTKAQIAREAGLEPLTDSLLGDENLDPEQVAAQYLNADAGFATTMDALSGARSILTERVAQDVTLAGELRERLWTSGKIGATASAGATAEGQGKYADYLDYAADLDSLPSHRVLALLRGEREGVLNLQLAEADPRDEAAVAEARAGYERAIASALGVAADPSKPAGKWLNQSIRVAWKARLLTRLESDLRTRLFEAAEDAAVKIFAANLRDVLLAAPAGNKAVLGLDPGLRTGVKVAVVDTTGKVVETATIYPHAPARKWDESIAVLTRLATTYGTELIAVGNGTAGRETDRLAAEVIRALTGASARKVIVSEAGASVYSASELASEELPDLDVSLRGAVSIARRLQDPMAELVKIDPKSIGVGQYQHDVTGSKLDRALDAVVEDCVNAVGVDVNTASAALLSRVAGVGPLLSRNIVEHRNAHGRFACREDLLKVPRLGAKAFEQCAGFLRITGGSEPLDASAVHPEAYTLAKQLQRASADSGRRLDELDPRGFITDNFGEPTIRDVIAELQRPGRDPRGEFVTATLKDGVETLTDVKPGMIMEGTVSNVAAFGAFVDLGVHQDGLIHVSAMSRKFISDPREVVTSGQIVKVKVLEVDPVRKRISLTLRLDDELPGTETPTRSATGTGRPTRERTGFGADKSGRSRPKAPHRERTANTAMAEALKRAGLG